MPDNSEDIIDQTTHSASQTRVNALAAGTPEPAAIAMTPPTETPERMSARDAASVLAKLRHTKPKDNEQPPAGEQRHSPAKAGKMPRRRRSSNRPPDLIRGTAPPLPTMEVRGETRE